MKLKLQRVKSFAQVICYKNGDSFRLFPQMIPIFSNSHSRSFTHSCGKHLFGVWCIEFPSPAVCREKQTPKLSHGIHAVTGTVWQSREHGLWRDTAWVRILVSPRLVWLWERHLPSLCLRYPLCETEMKTGPPLRLSQGLNKAPGSAWPHSWCPIQILV